MRILDIEVTALDRSGLTLNDYAGKLMLSGAKSIFTVAARRWP